LLKSKDYKDNWLPEKRNTLMELLTEPNVFSAWKLTLPLMTMSFLNKGRYLVRTWRGIPCSAHGRAGSMGLLDRQEELHDGQAGDSGIL